MARAEKRQMLVKSFLTSCAVEGEALLVHKYNNKHGKSGIDLQLLKLCFFEMSNKLGLMPAAFPRKVIVFVSAFGGLRD